MTEADWLAATDPTPLLGFVRDINSRQVVIPGGLQRVSDRKLRLFACACCRQAWADVECQRCEGTGRRRNPATTNPVSTWLVKSAGSCPDCRGTGKVGKMTDERSYQAVQVAELFADGEATESDLMRARQEAQEAKKLLVPTLCDLADECVQCCNDSASYAAAYMPRDPNGCPLDVQAVLLRDLVGNPFQPMKLPLCSRCDGDGKAHGSDRPFEWSGPGSYPGPCPKCAGKRHDCYWLTPTVVALARSIYIYRSFDRLPMLGDALLDAGCANEALVQHCHSAGPHTRGCWALDLLLGKE